MAHDEGDDYDKKVFRTSRRNLLKAAGVTTVALGLGGVGSATADPVAGADTVVDLGNEGLTDGDAIDPYLDTHLADGVEVRIPAGEYQYTGAGLAGEYANAALVGSADGVVFQRPANPETEVRPTITARSGAVRIANITVRGQCGQAQSRWRVGANADARLELINVNFPSGSVAESESMGVYAGTDHAGLLWTKNCHFGTFSNVALHVSDPIQDGNGRVVIEDSTFVNTGTAAIRAAPNNSVIRGCYFEASSAAPTPLEGTQQRGIELTSPGSNVSIEDCDFNWGVPGTSVLDFAATGEGGDGTVDDIRLTTGDSPLFNVEWDIEAGWTGQNINISEA